MDIEFSLSGLVADVSLSALKLPWSSLSQITATCGAHTRRGRRRNRGGR